MNKKFLLGVAVVAVLVYFFSRSNENLPGGNISQDKVLDSSIIVTPGSITGRPQVEITTSKGVFTVELRPDVAPKTVNNFLSKWNSDYCTNKTFHRVEDWVVQGCDPKSDGTGGNTNLPTETSTISFTAGSLGVARRTVPKDMSNDSQFFIVKKDSTFLDGEYTYFGKVVSGMDVVNKLAVGDKITSTNLLTK
jgi:peptidyl-prolyl cis-trans isomerase B (cyclophilin B)